MWWLWWMGIAAVIVRLAGGLVYNVLALLFPTSPADFEQWYGGGVCVVTGGSGGIGLALCERLVQRGMRLVIVARGGAETDEARHRLGHALLALVEADLAFASEHERVIAAVLAAIGGHKLALAAMPSAEMDAILTVNAVFTTRLTQALLPLLIAGAAARPTGRAAVVVLSSMAGLVPSALASVYGASKAFGVGLARALRTELRSQRVDVLAVAPGMVDCGNTPAWFGRARIRRPDVASAAQVADGVLRLVRPTHAAWPTPAVLQPTLWHLLYATVLGALPMTWTGEIVHRVHAAAAARVAAMAKQ